MNNSPDGYETASLDARKGAGSDDDERGSKKMGGGEWGICFGWC